jgi:hypothetical protein
MGLGTPSPSHLAISRAIPFVARVFSLLVPLVTALVPAAAHAAENGDFAGPVDIGGGRSVAAWGLRPLC